MEKSLEEIKQNQADYKWCRCCNSFNSNENKVCHACGSTDFEFNLVSIIENEIHFHAQNFNEEPDEVFVTVQYNL
jgi:RNA polymerase subunit RPABC4/transcription elongation factor Spt4